MTWDWLPLLVTQATPGPDEGEPGLWAIRIGVFGLCAVALGLVVWGTLFLRHGPMESATRWVLLVAFLVLSPLVYAMNFGLAISGAKPVAFCNSCHVMNAYVADLQNPDSEHLAAQHYQFRWIADHQCYTCHSDYGLFGDVDAKIAGLRHVWFNYVAGYDIPLEIRGTYDNQRCLHCHGPVKAYREVPEHQKNEATIGTSETSCIGASCHVSPHPKAAARGESPHAL